MADPRITVPAPARVRRVGGFLAVIPVVDLPRLPASAGVEWESLPCGVTQPSRGNCWGVLVDEDKDARQEIGWSVGSGSTLLGYYGVECYLGNADYEALAAEGLRQSEDAYLEHATQQLVFNVSDDEIATASTWIEAIAVAEDYADTRHRGEDEDGTGYIARPILWMNRGDVTRAYAERALVAGPAGSGELYTVNGTPVVSSGELVPGSLWISGFATLYRSPIVVHRAIDQTINRELAIAERAYALGFDCMEPVRVAVEAPEEP